jgi:hypothetical protein
VRFHRKHDATLRSLAHPRTVAGLPAMGQPLMLIENRLALPFLDIMES